MGETLETLKVVIEGTAAPFKKAANDAKQSAKELNNAVNSETGKVKNPFAKIFSDASMKQIQNMKGLIKNTMTDMKSGALPGSIGDGIKNYVKNAQLASGVKVRTGEYQQNERDIERADKALQSLQQKQRDMTATGAKKDSEEYKKLAAQIRQAERARSAYTGKKLRMEGLGQDTQFAHTGAISNATSSVGAVAGNVKNSIGSALGNIKGEKMISGLSSAASGLKSVFGKVTPVIKSAGGAFASLIQKFKAGIPLFGKAKSQMHGMGQTGRGLTGILKTIAMTAKFMFASFLIMGALRSAKEGMQNLAQYSGETNRSLSMLMSSLTQLKNSFATAFSPVLSVIVPILSKLIGYIVSAMNVIGQFFAALTGKSSYVRAKKVQQDYASSLNSNAAGANKANKANKELQKTLLGFDQINKLDDNSDKGSSGGSGGGGGGGLSPGDMFETVGIDSGIADFVKKIKDMFAAGDYEGIGQLIGEKINGAVAKISDFIDWNNVGGQITKFVNAFTRIFNSLIATIDWDAFGRMFGKGINTIVNTLYLFLTGINWKQLGSALAAGLNGLVYEVDWTKLGATIGAFFQAKIDGLYGFVTTADWPAIGKALGNGVMGLVNKIDFGRLGATLGKGLSGAISTIHNFVNTINWRGLGKKISSSINSFFKTTNWKDFGMTLGDAAIGILDMLTEAIEKIDWGQVATSIVDFLAGVDWAGVIRSLIEFLAAALGGLAKLLWDLGKALVDGIVKGIKIFFSDPIGIIKKYIFDPFIKGFKSAFGIHSPSTVMAEQGGFIIKGLLKGLMNNIKSVVTWFRDLPNKVKGAIGNVKDWIKQKGSDMIEGIKNGYEAVKDSKLFSKVKKLKNDVFEKIGNIKDKVVSKGKDIISGVRNGFDAIKNSKLLSTVGKLKDNVKTSIGNIAGKVVGKGKDIISGMKGGFEGSKSLLKTAVSKLPTLITSGIGNLWDLGKKIVKSFINGFTSLEIPTPHFEKTGNITFAGIETPIPKIGVKWYAKGGLPEMGEMFVAREAGPEMVGRIGRRSAVANNGQIVEAVASGVYDAVTAAMGNSNSGESGPVTIEFVWKTDERAIYRMAVAGKRKEGRRYVASAEF